MDNENKAASPASSASRCYQDERSVVVRIKATPNGLRDIAAFMEQQGKGKSVRVNWYTVQIEFVHWEDKAECALS